MFLRFERKNFAAITYTDLQAMKRLRRDIDRIIHEAENAPTVKAL